MAAKKERKGKFIGVWVTESEWKLLNKEAHKQEISFSALMRQRLFGKGNK